MALSTNVPVGTAQVEEICKLRDDVYRNRWITFAYWDISRRLHNLIGDNANWCTFSTWSSRTIGENLRLDKATRRIDELIYDKQTSISPRDHPWLLRLQYRVTTRDDGAAQQALALGNRLIFHEIGYAVIQLLEWVDQNPGFDLTAWKQYRASKVNPYPATDLFPKADKHQLWSGLDCYYEARNPQIDEQRRAELVLRGGVLLGAYEQTRADTMLKVALDPFPGDLVRALQPDPHAPAQLSLGNASRSWPRRVMAPVFGGAMTRWVMALDVPLFAWTIRPLRLGHGIPRPDGRASLYPPALQTLPADLSALFGEHDRSGGNPGRCAAQNWTRLPDRMNFIVNLFRAGQQDDNLYRPLPDADLRTLNLDLGDAKLDELRQLGDEEVDTWVSAQAAKSPLGPGDFLKSLVDDGFQNLIRPYSPKPDLPDWADRAKLWAGQDFFRKFGLEIGSALFSASLPLSYTAARGAHVLITTTQLVSNPRRRLGETGQMLLDAMASDDSSKPPLDRDTWAYNAALGVRLFHGAVRHTILNDPAVDWQQGDLGVPINQEDLLGTLVVFTVVVIESLDQMGVTCTVQDRDAYLHLWLVIGHLLGIDYTLLDRRQRPDDEQPLTYAEMQLVARVILKRNEGATPGGQTLMAALLGVSEGSMPFFLKGFPRTLTRRLIGDKSADMLGVPSAGPMRLMTALLRPFNSIISPYVRTNALGGLSSALTRRLYRWWIRNGRGDGSRPRWRVPRQWTDKAPTRARRGISEAVNRSTVLPRPAKQVISGVVSLGLKEPDSPA
jgi:mpaB/rubber oxygenase-like protein